MKLTSSAAAVWWVVGRGAVRDGLGLCVGAALVISDCYVNVCTKFYAKTGDGHIRYLYKFKDKAHDTTKRYKPLLHLLAFTGNLKWY